MPNRRLALSAVAVSLVPVGLGARALPGVIGDVAGGLLYAGLVYVLCAFIAPRTRSLLLGIVAGAIGVGVELLQLTSFPSTVAGALPVARYVLGSTFAATDLVVALVGASIAAVVDSGLSRGRQAARSPKQAAYP